eukprot:gene10273-8249_t
MTEYCNPADNAPCSRALLLEKDPEQKDNSHHVPGVDLQRREF